MWPYINVYTVQKIFSYADFSCVHFLNLHQQTLQLQLKMGCMGLRCGPLQALYWASLDQLGPVESSLHCTTKTQNVHSLIKTLTSSFGFSELRAGMTRVFVQKLDDAWSYALSKWGITSHVRWEKLPYPGLMKGSIHSAPIFTQIYWVSENLNFMSKQKQSIPNVH